LKTTAENADAEYAKSKTALAEEYNAKFSELKQALAAPKADRAKAVAQLEQFKNNNDSADAADAAVNAHNVKIKNYNLEIENAEGSYEKSMASLEDEHKKQFKSSNLEAGILKDKIDGWRDELEIKKTLQFNY